MNAPRGGKRRRVLFAFGDADWKYTRGKLAHLARRVAAEGFEVRVASHSGEISAELAAAGLVTATAAPASLSLTPEQSMAMTELMIRYTQDVSLPGSGFALWKTMAMDDYLGALNVTVPPPLGDDFDVLVYPLMGVDNNTTAASHFYAAMLFEAKKRGAPVVGLEVSPLGNRQTLGASLADLYAVKGERSRTFLLCQELASEGRVFVLPELERYLLECREDPYLDGFLGQEEAVRERLGLAPRSVVVFVPHNVAFVHEVRRILAALARLSAPLSVIVRADPNIARHGLAEREIVERACAEELGRLRHAVVDDTGGWLWTLLAADAVVAPAFSVFTELSAFYGKLTVVCQPWVERREEGNLVCEPDAERAAGARAAGAERRVACRSLGGIVAAALEGEELREELADGA
jgi:hypothetical protein